jgi:hypothetical protein
LGFKEKLLPPTLVARQKSYISGFLIDQLKFPIMCMFAN